MVCYRRPLFSLTCADADVPTHLKPLYAGHNGHKHCTPQCATFLRYWQAPTWEQVTRLFRRLFRNEMHWPWLTEWVNWSQIISPHRRPRTSRPCRWKAVYADTYQLCNSSIWHVPYGVGCESRRYDSSFLYGRSGSHLIALIL